MQSLAGGSSDVAAGFLSNVMQNSTASPNKHLLPGALTA